MIMKFRFFILFGILYFFSILTWAAEDSAFLEKARTRQYLGGADESDLKVQAQLVKLQKSKNETTIEDEEGF